MTKEDIKKTISHSLKNLYFYQILRKKISILPNLNGKKSVYTDKISISGRSAMILDVLWVSTFTLFRH